MNPKHTGKLPGSPEEWLEHARSDLRLARLAAGDASIRREQACFHAQQAAEKAIKAVLLSRQAGFPLTHDIEELLELAERSGLPVPKPVEDAGLLTPYAVETRYPGYWLDVTGLTSKKPCTPPRMCSRGSTACYRQAGEKNREHAIPSPVDRPREAAPRCRSDGAYGGGLYDDATNR